MLMCCYSMFSLQCKHITPGSILQARFKYPPHWVPLPMLYEAMQYVDPVTGQPRGFLRISARPLLDSVLLTLDIRSNKWQAANEFVRTTAPRMLQVGR